MATVEINPSDGLTVQIAVPEPNTVNLTQPVNSVIEVTTLGPQGPQGPQGEPGDGFPFDGGIAQVTGSLQVTGSSTITGSLNVSQGITGSLLGTSSWATNSLTASYALNASNVNTSSLVTTSSFNNFTSSYNTGSFSGSFIGVFTGSLLGTASKVTIGGLGTNVYPLAIISPSGEIVTASGFTFNGSSNFFNLPSDYTLYMPGASTVNAGTFSGNVTGNVTGTSSFATSASRAVNSNSASFSLTASYYQETDPIFIAKSASLATTGSNQFNGNQTITGSLIQGLGNAAGENSHAEGDSTQAIGSFSHAEGLGTIAYGDRSHAEGQDTIASGSYSHAEGYQTIALADHQHVQGQWNATSSIPAAFIVGNGTDGNNRSNLIHAVGNEVQISGSMIFSTGGITGSLFGTASLANRNLLTASVSSNVLTFTKGDGSSFELTINTGSGGGGSVGTLAQVTALGAITTTPITASIISASSFTGSLFGTSSWAVSSSRTISSSHALTASYALSGGSGGGSNLGSIFITLYDGGANLTTGKKDTPVYVPYDGTFTGWEMLAYNSSNNLMTASCVVDVIQGRFITLPISTASSIAGTQKPTLTNQSSSFSSSLSTWTSLTAGDYIQAEIESVSTGVAKITVAIKVTKF